uniref:hypothetical protein n=1 Tax=Inonotus hispidus TaxID=40469 RepID=UPI002182213C|nr:hypothetical protein N4M07_mgp060 [Inonotus hispidus]UVF37992.1 hypothetical protein [Inonotus hispidus]
MKIKKFLPAVILFLISALFTYFVLDFLFDLKADSLIAASNSNNVAAIDNQFSMRNIESVKNVTSTITNNITDSTNHLDLKDPVTIALLSVTGVVVLVVVFGTSYLIYNYLQLPLEAQQNINTIELQNM